MTLRVTLFRLLTILVLCGRQWTPAYAQSQAIDGTLQGAVRDASGALVPQASVVARNENTGLIRETWTDDGGRFRLPLLPPGRYVLTVKMNGFKTSQKTGIVLAAGDTVPADVTLEIGNGSEEVIVRADATMTRPGRTDTGGNFTAADLTNLPSPLRNPLNPVMLLPGVIGTEADELNQPRLIANGSTGSFQLDGNSNTQRDRSGLRLVPLSPIMVDNIAVTTAGFAPEFGQTTGMVVNVVTPSGTNQLAGLVNLDFSPAAFVARPPLLDAGSPNPSTHSLGESIAMGGPIVANRIHFYGGYERRDRDSGSNVITIKETDAARLGLDLPSGRVIEDSQTEHFYIGKLDFQPAPAHRLSFRLLGFYNDSPSIGVSGLTSPERMVDLFARMASGAVQLSSTLGPATLYELRLQTAARRTYRLPSPVSASGPAVDVNGIASFGGPFARTQDAHSDFYQRTWQATSNVSHAWRGHFLKAGGDLQRISDRRVNTPRRVYTFATTDAYLSAKTGTNPFAYVTYTEDTGNTTIEYGTTMIGAFFQDDIPIAERLQVQIGVRYDAFLPPTPERGASTGFKTDWNNFAPRAALAWGLDGRGRTVIRASAGQLFEAPPLLLYQEALTDQLNLSRELALGPTSIGAPRFPGTASTTALTSTPAARPSITRVADDFRTQSAWLYQLQIERAVGAASMLSLGYTRSSGAHLPVLIDRNLIPTSASLTDGRPIYDPVVSAASRVNPAYDHIDVVESIGRSRYDAVTAAFRTRVSTRLQLDTSYTWSRSRNNAPLTNAYVQGSRDDRLSDYASIDRDYGPTTFDQPHTFVMSGVASPPATGSGLAAALLRGLNIGFVVQANNGMPANIRANRDLNRDGRPNDRPLAIDRNSDAVGAFTTLDLRFAERLPLKTAVAIDFFVSIKNVFNALNPSSVNRVVSTSSDGQLLAPIPEQLPATDTYTARRAQAGIAVKF